MIVIVRSKSIDNNSKNKFSNSVNFKDLGHSVPTK